ncbi:hypothetical protein KGR20_09700 [Cytobacillus oceanisediminis]|uniref:hypothetical protein n=1 Tax=Cytobacillus oceanisediminis TaxID=665099 RepID=UPI001CCB90E7|nr:hypothetical protein [Cytobacillus oceanisediminis]MBZ9534530.1 hypothetical protein [Cytobacillus oceanisediminis]
MFYGYEQLSELEKAQVLRLRDTLSHYTDKEFSLYVTMFNAIESVTKKSTIEMSLESNLKEVCDFNPEIFNKVYYITCHYSFIPLPESDLDAQEAYTRFETVGDMFEFLSKRKLL